MAWPAVQYMNNSSGLVSQQCANILIMNLDAAKSYEELEKKKKIVRLSEVTLRILSV